MTGGRAFYARSDTGLAQDTTAAAPGPASRASPEPQAVVTAVGDSGLLVELSTRIAPETEARVRQLDEDLAAAGMAGLVEVIVGYTSLLLVLDPLQADHEEIARQVRMLVSAPLRAGRAPRRWRVPVAYGGEAGFDLQALADRHGMTAAAVVAAHAGARYRVAMFGFLPGFAYLSGLPAELATPRRETPRTRVPAGSIAIGGAQTALGSIEGPCGWHVIGRTPLRSFDPARYPATVFAPGDEIEFTQIDMDTFDALAARTANGELVAERLA